MGQKVHPTSLRLGIIRTWDSRWYADKEYASFVEEDFKVRKFLKKKLFHAGISKIEIERFSKQIRLRVFAARSEIALLKQELERILNPAVLIDIKEVRRPEIDAQLVAENIALQLERRIAFRRAMKRSVSSAMRFGAQGIKIICSGRLGGAEMARTEWYKEGRIPLHTLRADVDYGFTEAKTTYGTIGIKTFIFKGEVLSPGEQALAK